MTKDYWLSAQPTHDILNKAKLPRQGARPVAASTFVYILTEQSQIVALDTSAARAEEAIKWRHQFDLRCASLPDGGCGVELERAVALKVLISLVKRPTSTGSLQAGGQNDGQAASSP